MTRPPAPLPVLDPVLLLVLVLVSGCGHHVTPPDHSRFDELVLDSPPGVSDLSLDDKGTLWAIPERDPFVLEIALPAGTITRHPLDGIPAGVDTEALAWLGPGQFAIGTEGAHVATASVLFGEQRGDRVVVTRERPLTDAELGVTLTANHGAEAVCGRGADLLIGIEQVGRFADGTRWAPIAHLHADRIATSRLHLTSATGKISALACTFAPDGSADAYAIERHYGITHLLHFRVPATPGDITPELVLDLGPVFHDAYNIEGLVRLPDGRFVVVNDNQTRVVSGPTALFFLH